MLVKLSLSAHAVAVCDGGVGEVVAWQVDVGRTHDFAVHDLLHAVGAPANHTGCGKEGGIEVLINTEHVENNACVQVDVGADIVIRSLSIF